jgi:mannosyltransferase
MPNSIRFIRAVLFLIGVCFVCFAVIVSNADYTNFLLGNNPKDLSFGPSLFRVLLSFHGILLIIVGLYGWGKSSKKLISKSEFNERGEPFNRFQLISLLVLSIAALLLRLWKLNTDLWVDEVFTLLDFARQPFGQILTSFPSQNQHLLFSILAHTSIETFGESAWALRLPSVFFGVASIWALFLLCRKLIGAREAILASALMTVSYHHIWFSQNARGYTGLLLFTLLATWLWFEALDKNSTIWWGAYAAAIVLGMTMAFVVAAHGMVFLALLVFPRLSGDKSNISPERRAGFRPFAAWVLSASITLQLYALALPEFLSVGLHEESNNSEWTNPLWVLTETLQNLSIGFAGIAVVLVGLAFVAFGWLRLFGAHRRAAFLMVLPPVFAGTLMLFLGHNLFPRFFFFAMGFGLIIVVHGAMELPAFLFKSIGFENAVLTLIQIRNPIGISLVLLIIAISTITVPRNYTLPKQDFSGAKNFVENNRSPPDGIVAISIAGEIYSRYFAPEWMAVKTVAELENIEQRSKKVWLVYTLAPEIKAFRPDLWQTIERDYETVKIFPGTLNGGEIFVCRKRPANEDKNETSRNFDSSEIDSVQR